jgi:hypothetical protein
LRKNFKDCITIQTFKEQIMSVFGGGKKEMQQTDQVYTGPVNIRWM